MRHVIQDTVHLIKNAMKNSVKVKGEQLYRGLENLWHNWEQVVRRL